jgi:hypothetical protein
MRAAGMPPLAACRAPACAPKTTAAAAARAVRLRRAAAAAGAPPAAPPAATLRCRARLHRCARGPLQPPRAVGSVGSSPPGGGADAGGSSWLAAASAAVPAPDPRRGGSAPPPGPPPPAPPPPPPPGASTPFGRRAFRTATRALSNLPLALGEMATLATLSSIGTVIEQNKARARAVCAAEALGAYGACAVHGGVRRAEDAPQARARRAARRKHACARALFRSPSRMR